LRPSVHVGCPCGEAPSPAMTETEHTPDGARVGEGVSAAREIGGPGGPAQAAPVGCAGPDAVRTGDSAGVVDDGYDADEDDVVGEVSKGFKYDWNAYRAAFGDMPVHRAVTTMFAEYAVLYSRIAGQATTSLPPTMTVDEGADIGAQATRFINELVTPLLGQINRTKVNLLLSHLCECVKLHGDLRNGNTGMNETLHKADKAYYLRTNKDPRTFTFQLVRQAQGARAALEKLYAADKDRADMWCEAGGSERAGGRPIGRRPRAHRRRRSARGVRRSKKMLYHLKCVPVGAIAQRPGLTRFPELVGLHANDKVRSVSRGAIDGVFECGGKAKQLLHCAEEFRASSWYDSVVYKPISSSSQRCVGEVRALIQQETGYSAVIMEMAPVGAEDDCPLAARGSQRVRWQMWDAEADCAIRVVPLEQVVRVVHVLPDFSDLAARRRFSVAPAARDAPLQDRLDMRYWLNAFYPWDM